MMVLKYENSVSIQARTRSGRVAKQTITKTRLYNFDPLKPHFYTVKLGFPGVYNIFLISAKNIDCGYSLEPPLRGGSNEYPQSMFWAEIWKKNQSFLSENFQFSWVKFSIYLNRHVFVMYRLIGRATTPVTEDLMHFVDIPPLFIMKTALHLCITVCFPAHQAASEKEPSLKDKKMLPGGGRSKLLPVRVNSFLEGVQKTFDSVSFLQNASITL